MGTFSSLGEKLNHVFSKLTKRGKLTELEIKQAMREIRIALLEADVNIKVAKDFINTVSEKAVGQEILKTLCGKLAFMLKKQGKKPLLVACDVYRPAAIKQLQVVGGQAGVEVFEMGQGKPVEISNKALQHAAKFGFDTVIIDTAGRLQIDEDLMHELEEINESVHPHEILLVLDSMTGQVAVNVAEEFNRRLSISGVVLTKLDGDTRGGACLSVKAVTGKPIKFCGVGEKLGDIEPFHPDRMANRILGMGDVLTLIEKAQEAVTEADAKKLEQRLKENAFDLNDYLDQIDMLKKMGGASAMMSMMPGMGKLKIKEGDIDENEIYRTKAIIQSMTEKERRNPQILNYSRKMRIAKGSGTSLQQINTLLKQYEQIKTLIKQMKSSKGKRLPFKF